MIKLLTKKILLFGAFWFLVFLIMRITFLVFNTNEITQFGEVFKSLFWGFRLDASMFSYLGFFPILLTFFGDIFHKKWISTIGFVITSVFLILYLMTSVGEILLYSEWKTKLNMTALAHFQNPDEVFKTVKISLSVTYILLVLGLYFILNLILRRLKNVFGGKDAIVVKGLLNYFSLILLVFSLIFFSVIGMRGGIQPIPIQSSDAYFSHNPLANDLAVNPLWNIMHQFFEYKGHLDTDKFNSFSESEADSIYISSIANEKMVDFSVFKNERPNIVLIILESWSALLTETYGQGNFTPFIDSLSKEGIAFTNIYAAGHVSDQGIPAVLSGYPALSQMSLANYSDKSKTLPSVNKDLSDLGYHDFFIFGGDLTYGNIKSYVYNMEFDIIKEEQDFDDNDEKGRLGIQDASMQKELSLQITKTTSPFFATWFTISSHMPYDYIGTKKKLVDHRENDYVNSVQYTDSCLKTFIKNAEKEHWYENTLFIFIADHSHNTHLNINNYNAEYHKIPLLWFGPVIKDEYKGLNINTVGSQIDLPKTLLNQLQLRKQAEQYSFAHDLFSETHPNHAYYCSFDGYGLVTNLGSVGFQFGLPNPVELHTTANVDSLSNIAHAFQQVVFKDFKNR